jgi:hypothetical protein
MTIWDDVSKEFKKAVEDGWTVVKAGAKTSKLRYKAHALHKEAEKVFADLGGVIYDLAKPPFDNPYTNPEVTRLIEVLRRLEAETCEVEDEADKTMKTAGKGGSAGAEKTATEAEGAASKKPQAKKPAAKSSTKKD